MASPDPTWNQVSYWDTYNWHDPCLEPGSFSLIYCRNSLRCSTKSYWRNSLRRFHELLASGVLLLENVNAIGIQGEVEELLGSVRFISTPGKKVHPSGSKFVLSRWPTG